MSKRISCFSTQRLFRWSSDDDCDTLALCEWQYLFGQQNCGILVLPSSSPPNCSTTCVPVVSRVKSVILMEGRLFLEVLPSLVVVLLRYFGKSMHNSSSTEDGPHIYIHTSYSHESDAHISICATHRTTSVKKRRLPRSYCKLAVAFILILCIADWEHHSYCLSSPHKLRRSENSFRMWELTQDCLASTCRSCELVRGLWTD